MSIHTEAKLQALLRGEIAAAETYAQALERTSGDHNDLLRAAQEDHGTAIRYFHKQLKTQGAEADMSSGIWGVFAKTVEGSALMVSDRLALQALRQGEAHGLRKYESAALDTTLPHDARRYLMDELIPQQRAHVRAFDRALAVN